MEFVSWVPGFRFARGGFDGGYEGQWLKLRGGGSEALCGK